MTTDANAANSDLRSLRSLSGFKLYGASLLVLALGAALSLAAFAFLQARARERERIEFERRAREAAGTLRSQLERPLEVLQSVCALFDSSTEVARDEFARFVRPALARHPGIRALEWIPLVPAGRRQQYEQAARADGLQGFRFTEVGKDRGMVEAAARPEHLPIYYMEPPDDRVLGFDLTAEPARRAPVDRARETRATVASERIRLVEDPPDSYSIAAFCPVFARTDAGGQAQLRGVGAEVFRMREVVEPALASTLASGMELIVLDLAAPRELRVLFESSPGLAAKGAQAWPQSPLGVSIDVADRRWSLTFARGPRYHSALNEPPWGALVAGVALSALFALALSATRVIRQLRHQVRAAQQLGQYTLVRKLGEGGMGVVWEARHALLRRPTALKLLRPERAGAEAISRFEREVQLTSQLTHPNTVAIYDYGRTAEGVFYYVMEYLDGVDLQRLVEIDGPQPPARVVHIMKQVASALAEAHELGLVHRDVKPANIVLCKRGGLLDVAKVVDFGLVKGAARPDTAVSDTQFVIGTPLFLAPESISDPAQVDARSDLYACGAVTYYLLTGHPVFDGQSVVEICSSHLYMTPIPPSERLARPLPDSLERVVLQCLQKKPSDRFSSARAMVDALVACGLPAWTEADARAAAQRLASKPASDVGTARTLPAHRSSLLVDLRVRADQRE